jgi:hypothetical protein
VTDARLAQRNIVLWATLGVVIGSVGALLLGLSWVQSESGARILVLGSGRQLSVLVVHDHRRVLIAGGTDGNAFSNALGQARSPLSDSIDVVLLDPGAGADVAERVRDLDARQFFLLPHPDFEPTSESVQRSLQIDLGSGHTIDVTFERGAWYAHIRSPAGEVLVTPGNSLVGHPSILISLDGSALAAGQSAAQISIAPAERGLETTGSTALVQPGDVMAIEIDGDQFRIDRDDLARD